MFTQKAKSLALVALFLNAQAASLLAQSVDSAVPVAAPPAPPLSNEELDQIVAPIALYPDSLLSQIFMASSYPLEIVQADRFAKANPKLTGDALTSQLESQSWDPSVKSLVNFPTVLAMMSEHLDSTIKLGDAFIADQKSVMDAVQRLRAKAQVAGNLQTTAQQTIIVEQAPQTNVQIIRIEPVSPQVIYVPTYNPVVVYGPWPYPTYPPYYYRPPGYVATSAVIGFGVGFACGAAWGYAWGNCNWKSNNVNVNINRNVNINTNINRAKYQNNVNINNNGNWQHNPAHRQGVPYSSNAAAQRYGGAASDRAVQSRDAYRGRTDAAQQNLNAGSANQSRGQNAASPSNRANTAQNGIQNRPASGQTANPGQNRPSTGQVNPGQNRPNTTPTGSAAQNRPANSTGNSATQNRGAGTGFNGVDGGANATRSASQRGNTSRHPSAAPSSGAGGTGRAGGAGGARK
jgi:hypothetical protein